MLNRFISSSKILYFTLTLSLLVALGLWLPVPAVLRLVAVTVFTCFLPGYLLLAGLNLRSDDNLAQLLLAAGLSYSLTILLALGLLYLTGSLAALPLTLGLGLLCLLLFLTALYRQAFLPSPLSPVPYSLSPLPLLLAAAFSLTHLGYADYWGDEMNGLLRALSIIDGQWEAIFEHTKGPVEILLPAVFGLLTGRFEPFTLRFPFALAYTLGIGGFYLLGQALFGRKVAFIAALLLAINGFYIAFGRMIQYQAVVLLMTVLSLLLAYRFCQQRRLVYLALSFLTFGVGLLAHYDILLALPPLLYLVWRAYGRQGTVWRENWLRLSAAGLILLGVTAIFYVPFFSHAHAGETSSYLSRRIIGDANWPVNNLDQLYLFSILYNSAYYLLFIGLLGAGVIIVDWVKLLRQHHRQRWLGLALGIALILTGVAVFVGRPSFGPLLLAAVLFGLPVLATTVPIERKMVYIWIGVSVIGYVFLVDYPRTHLRIIYPGWSLLAGLALVDLGREIQRRLAPLVARRVLVAAGAVLLLLFGLFAYYEYLLFVDTRQEYIFTYPEHKNPLYWEDAAFPFGSRRLYGAPHRLGWQMINQLYQQGRLQGDWDSNDQGSGSNLFWYTLGAPRHPCYPRYYFLTQFEQKQAEENTAPDWLPANYVEIGQVWNRDRLQMQVYEFNPLGSENEAAVWPEPARYPLALTPADFQTSPGEEPVPAGNHPLDPPPAFRLSPAALEQIAAHYNDQRIVQVRDKVALMGYDLDQSWAEPGGALLLTLYWQAREVVNLPYKLFAHLERANGEVMAQSDDFPACGTISTQGWSPGQVIADRHLLRLPAGLPADTYRIRVGLYEPQTGLRMDLLDALENPQGTSYELLALTLPPPG